MKKIKLLVIISAFAKNKKDSGDFTLDLSWRLNRKFDVTVLAPHETGLQMTEKIRGLEVRRFVYFCPKSWQCLAYGGGIPYNLKTCFWAKIQVPFFFLAELVAAVKLMRQKKIDVIQSHWLLPQGIVGAIGQKYYHRPHVATIHSSEVTVLKKIPFGRQISEFILLNSTSIISVSRHRLAELLDFVSPKVKLLVQDKSQIIPMGINLDHQINRAKTIKNGQSILFVGRLVEVKGCQYLVQAFAHIAQSIKNATLTIVGEGPLMGKLKKMTFDLKVSDKIKFLGFVDHDQIGFYYRQADVVVFPSIVDASGYQEGLPVVLLEALSSGKIVVAADTPGAQEVIQDGLNGYLVKQKNSSALAKKIIMVLKRKNSQSMIIEAKKTAQRFDWDKVARRYAQAIEKTGHSMLQ